MTPARAPALPANAANAIAWEALEAANPGSYVLVVVEAKTRARMSIAYPKTDDADAAGLDLWHRSVHVFEGVANG